MNCIFMIKNKIKIAGSSWNCFLLCCSVFASINHKCDSVACYHVKLALLKMEKECLNYRKVYSVPFVNFVAAQTRPVGVKK